MKLAYPVATPEVRAPILGLKGPAAEVFPALRDAGYDAIEPFVADPEKFDVDEWIRALEGSSLSVVAVGTGPVVSDDQLTFTAPDPGARRLAIERAKTIVRFAARLGTQVNIGKLRGVISADQPSHSWTWMRSALREVCEGAARQGVTVTLEPQNRAIIDNLNTARAALDFLAELSIPNLRLMVDTFHMVVEREDINAGFRAAAEAGALLHVHFADTDRHPPGDGDIDFGTAISALRQVGYDRGVTVEIKPEPDAITAARRAAEHLRPLLSRR